MLAVAVVVAGGGALAGLALRDSGGEGANGAGFTYRGDFYGMSGAEVRPERLGPVLERGVPAMDTRTDVREILGIDPAVAVAAHFRDVGGTAAEEGAAWLLMSPQQDVVADPWADPDVSDAVSRPR